MKPALLLILAASPLAAAAEDTFLLRGATVHPVSGANVAEGSVLVRDGRIAEVGAKIAAPKGVRVIDVRGLHVYPGLINAATTVGLAEISAVRESNDITELGDFKPQLRTAIAINPASEHIPVTRANGVTTVLVVPEGGIIAGQAALVHLDGWTIEDMEVARSAAMELEFPRVRTTSSGRGGGGQATRVPYADAKRRYDKEIRDLDDFFAQSRRYQKARTAGEPGFRTDLKFEAMIPVIEGKLPVLVKADREKTIREAIQFAEKERIRMILEHAPEAWKVADALKARNIPVTLGPTLALPLDEDDPYDRPFTSPADLHRAGVKFAFGSFNSQFARNIGYQASAAAAFGLPAEEALKAVTLNAAEIFGVADRIGSIDKGKWADLIVTDGDPLETRTQVRKMFIKGRAVDLDSKHVRLYEKYIKRE